MLLDFTVVFGSLLGGGAAAASVVAVLGLIVGDSIARGGGADVGSVGLDVAGCCRASYG